MLKRRIVFAALAIFGRGHAVLRRQWSVLRVLGVCAALGLIAGLAGPPVN